MNKPSNIGIVCAHPREMRAVSSVLKNASLERFSLFKGYTGMLEGSPSVVIGSGMGGDSSYLATKQIIPLFQPGLIVDFGVAAGLRSDLHPGDVIAAEKVVDLSYFLRAWKEEDPFFSLSPSLPGKLELEEIPMAEESMKLLREIEGLISGVIGSADFTLQNSMVREELARRGIDAFDNETFSVVGAASEAGISCISVRAISDLGCENALEEFQQNFKAAIKNALDCLRKISLTPANSP